MKKFNKSIYIILALATFTTYSCEDYLDKTVEADITEEQVFSSFPTFQGFIETLYYDVIDFTVTGNNSMDFNWGDDVVYRSNRRIQEGQYVDIGEGRDGIGPYHCAPGSVTRGNEIQGSRTVFKGVWNNGWLGIRDANIALAHLDQLVNPTQEERQLLEGQAYFFRGYFHWQIMKQWGGIPYIDTVFNATDEMRVPQESFHDCALKVIADLQKAAELLPIDWDQTTVGQKTLGINRGRLTKGMALSFITEVNLWLASPLINGVTTGNYTYDVEYCKKTAAAAWKVIELANQGVYSLEPWATYSDLFKKNNRTEPGMVSEVIFKAAWQARNARWFCLQWVLPHAGGETNYDGATLNQVERFEMAATGLPIDDPASGFDPTDPWSGRDPRFDFSIVVDGDRIVENRNDDVAFAQFYLGGRDRIASGTQTGFGYKKFIYTNWNSFDNGWGSSSMYCLPILRLAEIYLMYAEAANEAYGPLGKDPDANLTAVDAVNLVRRRAQMPDVNAKFTGSADAFRERIRNERSVELVHEAKRRDDLRRWYVAHLPEYKDLYACDFPQDHSYFKKSYIKSIVFDLKHYWFPFPAAQVMLYDGWKQNPGW